MLKIKLISLLLILTNQVVCAQGQYNSLECIQGIWRGTSMDIEPFADISTLFQIIQGDSIYAFHLGENGKFSSKFKLLNVDIEGKGIDFYDVSKKNILSIDSAYDGHRFYTEIDDEGNVAVDRDFFCGENLMSMLYFGYERQQFVPYTVYRQIKAQALQDNRDYIAELNILNKLKKAAVIADTTYFYNDTNDSTKRKEFVVKGDHVIIDRIAKPWVRAAYEGKNTTTEGWLKSAALKIVD